MSEAECECPTRATLLPPTVIEENVPVDLVMAFCVTPVKALLIAETDADTVAMFPLRVDSEALSPVTCDIVWVCPSNATALPFTVNELASRVEKVTWSKSVAAYRSAPLYILCVSLVKYSLLDFTVFAVTSPSNAYWDRLMKSICCAICLLPSVVKCGSCTRIFTISGFRTIPSLFNYTQTW